ncbi:uncharacterized protein N7479_003340 [Penicillium vulpinum]|uniref:uncharacterized protein n=1 Tax=Penicillium vulpinum TaxID=29845 RepID=UPI0025483260|nr:uncharacterized protein N7479_003340 [Penicillium vulpinum]KAJ5963464.1 hypothetical protein N7479_003340 [Penicillium vulpinum]
MGQKGPPSISNPSSFRLIAGHSGNDSDENKKENKETETPEDDIDKDLDEFSEQEYAHPSGHAMSMQGTLLQPAPPTLDSDSRWQVSADVFQKLFEMADRLDLNGYITPVQAWNRIRDHEKFPRLSREKLKTLENAMRPNIRCQGFAAIMEEPIFEILLNKALGP